VGGGKRGGGRGVGLKVKKMPLSFFVASGKMLKFRKLINKTQAIYGK
jgi:hypothetical protein